MARVTSTPFEGIANSFALFISDKERIRLVARYRAVVVEVRIRYRMRSAVTRWRGNGPCLLSELRKALVSPVWFPKTGMAEFTDVPAAGLEGAVLKGISSGRNPGRGMLLTPLPAKKNIWFLSPPQPSNICLG